MLLSIHPQNPDKHKIKLLIEALKTGAVIIYPTDTIYGIGCDIYSQKAIEKICKIKQIQSKNAQFSFICSDLSAISKYTKTISTPTFRILKNILPGPYTCILEASKEVPKILKTKRDTVGIRVPDHPICQHIIESLGNPIVSTSLPEIEDVDYLTDPEVIEEYYGHLVDFVVDGGIGHILASTVVDFTGGIPEVIRLGAGNFDFS